MDAIQDLAADLLEARGELRFVVERNIQPESTPIIPLVDAFVQKHGMTGIGALWAEVIRSIAVRHLARILHHDLAYSSVERMRPERAEQLAERFVSMFPDARFFTNTLPPEIFDDSEWSGEAGWIPVTDATFDSGIIAVGRELVGLLWVEDED